MGTLVHLHVSHPHKCNLEDIETDCLKAAFV